MRDSFRFLTGHSDGASNSQQAQRYCYDALIALVDYNEHLVDTTVTPFRFQHNGRTFQVESLSYGINPLTNRRRYMTLIRHGQYVCELSYIQNGIDA